VKTRKTSTLATAFFSAILSTGCASIPDYKQTKKCLANFDAVIHRTYADYQDLNFDTFDKIANKENRKKSYDQVKTLLEEANGYFQQNKTSPARWLLSQAHECLDSQIYYIEIAKEKNNLQYWQLLCEFISADYNILLKMDTIQSSEYSRSQLDIKAYMFIRSYAKLQEFEASDSIKLADKPSPK